MFAWSAQRPFAGVHPKPKHCLCIIIDEGGHWGQPGGEWISQDGLPSPWIAVSRQHSKGLGIGSQQWSSVGPRTSSIWQSVPSEPSSILDIVRWKISGTELIPNGSLLKQKRPNGVTKVVSNFDSSSRGICRNQLLASSLGKILLSPSLPRFSSTEGIWCISCWNALLRWVRSTQISTLPFCLRTGMIPAHHSVAEALFLSDFLPLESVNGGSFFDCTDKKEQNQGEVLCSIQSSAFPVRWRALEIWLGNLLAPSSPLQHLCQHVLWALVQHRLSCWVTNTSGYAPHI